MLRKCTGTPNQQVTPLHLVDSSTTLILEPFAILDQRTLFRGSTSIPQYLIQWSGLPATDATWEDKTSLQKSFPNFHLEDKVFLNEAVMLCPQSAQQRANDSAHKQQAQTGSERVKEQKSFLQS
ncbi:putative chromatin remodeling & transcriptional activation CHROMO-DOMAIN family [Helianthus annuus]|nr:putative chromatin remodeling & transcriptional activation CHROMO-DOMAIN family [Helianthus annuus]